MATPSNNGSPWKAAFLATAIGTDLVVCMVAGYFLGKLLQTWISPSPLWLVLSIMLGFITGVIGAYWLVRRHLEGNS